MIPTTPPSHWYQNVYGQRTRSTARIMEVAQVAEYVSATFEADPLLGDLWLRGEVSNLSRSSAGHYYFCLKDQSGQLRSVLFRGNALRGATVPTAGSTMVAHGRVTFYPPQGAIQLVVDALFPEGIGLAQMQFEALYRRLEAEGLFDAGRKRALPRFPRCIGIATSETGAVIHDLLTVLGRRYPLAHVVLASTVVQGDGAPRGVIRAMESLNAWRDPATLRGVDLIIVARGGGSAEDLACFNDEGLARAIFASAAPVVSAIGHESDVTLADFVADVRAPTPSAAAEIVAPDILSLRSNVQSLRSRGESRILRAIENGRLNARYARSKLVTTLLRRLEIAREQVTSSRLQLEVLNPDATLARGYAIAEHMGRVLRTSYGLGAGDTLSVRLSSGSIDACVTAANGGVPSP